MGGYVGSSRAVTLTTTSVDVEGDIDLTGDIKILTSSGGTYTITGADTTTNKTIDVNSLTPSGIVSPFAGSNAPDGWQMCNGQELSQTTHSSLFAVIGTTYNTGGETSGYFRVPDLRGRVVAGLDTMGSTTSQDRLTGLSGGVDGDTLGATGGDETHILTDAQMPSHNHQVTLRGGSEGSLSGVGQVSSASDWSSTATTNTNTQGSDSPHNNVQPTIILNYIIKE